MRVAYAMLAKNWTAGQSVAVSIEGGPVRPRAPPTPTTCVVTQP